LIGAEFTCGGEFAAIPGRGEAWVDGSGPRRCLGTRQGSFGGVQGQGDGEAEVPRWRRKLCSAAKSRARGRRRPRVLGWGRRLEWGAGGRGWFKEGEARDLGRGSGAGARRGSRPEITAGRYAHAEGAGGGRRGRQVGSRRSETGRARRWQAGPTGQRRGVLRAAERATRASREGEGA